jgi:hypothetical protein
MLVPHSNSTLMTETPSEVCEVTFLTRLTALTTCSRGRVRTFSMSSDEAPE